MTVGESTSSMFDAARRGLRSRAGQRARARRLGYSALGYLGQARQLLREATVPEPGTTPALRFATAHLAALRAAAAVLAARGRPARRRVGSAWSELAEIAGELDEWAAVFAESAALRAAAEAGLAFPLRHGQVDAFCRLVADFIVEVEELLDVDGQTVLPTAS